MKILMLTPYLPYPPAAGGQIRSYNIIKHLSKNHEITLACFTRDTNTKEQIKHMEKFCKKVIIFKRGKAWTLPNILRTGFSLYPFLIMIYYTPQVIKILQQEISRGNYDLIHAETFYVMPFIPKTTLPVVLVEQTIMSRVFTHEIKGYNWLIKPLLWIDVAKINFWEKYYWRKVKRLVAVSDEDAVLIKKAIPGKKVDVNPNGVGEDLAGQSKKIHYNHKILYMGNYKWMQNWEAAEMLATKVFPLVKKEIKDAKLLIAGQFPTQHLKSFATGDIKIIEISDNDSAGVVNAYKEAGLLVAPIYGPGGTRLKTLAAMASMVPVVTTPIGSEGYLAKDGESILVGKTSEELALQTIRVLKDRALYEKIANNARRLVDEKFTWHSITKKLGQIYEKVIDSNS